MKGKRQLWQNLRKGTISSPQRPGIFEPRRWNLAAPFHPLSISAAAPDVSSSSEVSSFPFGDAQSAVVPQPGSPHHRAIKSAGKNPAETSLLRHNSKKKGGGGDEEGGSGSIFCSDVSWRRRSLPRVPSELCRPAGGKEDAQGTFQHPAGCSRCPKVSLVPGVGSVLGSGPAAAVPGSCESLRGGVGECGDHSRA